MLPRDTLPDPVMETVAAPALSMQLFSVPEQLTSVSTVKPALETTALAAMVREAIVPLMGKFVLLPS